MIIASLWEQHISVHFSYLPAWELFASMHVLQQPEHHVRQQDFIRRVEEDRIVYRKEHEYTYYSVSVAEKLNTGFYEIIPFLPEMRREVFFVTPRYRLADPVIQALMNYF